MKKVLSFKDTPGLGNVVKSSKAFCKLIKNMKDVTAKYIIGDFKNPSIHGLAGHKFSRLCGFTFESTVNSTSPMFQIVYVPKLRATLTRNDKALSGWYCWEVLDGINRRVVSIAEMKRLYDFDVTAFFHSDLFEKYLPQFKANVQYVLGHQIKDLLDSIPDTQEKTELKFYVNAIAKAITEIQDVQKYIIYDNNEKLRTTADNPNAVANLAYNANKTYRLKDIDKNSPDKKPIDQTIKRKSAQANTPNKVKFDPSLKYKFGGGRTNKQDAEIFDKYDDYDNDDYR